MWCQIAGHMRTEPHPGYCQRVKRPLRRPGAVIEYFRQGKFPHVLAIELSRDLRPGEAPEPRAEQEAQSQPSRHSVLPRKVLLPVCEEQGLAGAAGAALTRSPCST